MADDTAADSVEDVFQESDIEEKPLQPQPTPPNVADIGVWRCQKNCLVRVKVSNLVVIQGTSKLVVKLQFGHDLFLHGRWRICSLLCCRRSVACATNWLRPSRRSRQGMVKSAWDPYALDGASQT